MGGIGAQFTGSSAVAERRPSRAVLSLLAVFVAACFLVGFVVVLSSPVARAQSGDLTVDIIAGYNLVVDSNAGSPSTFAPSVATVVGRFCNTGASTLTGVQGYIGDYDGGVSPTPGIYPARNSAIFPIDHPLYNTGWYTFTHLGGALGTADATRFVGTLAPGECKVQYWHFTYPQCTNVGGVPDAPPCIGNPVWGDSVKPEDDLWLQFDIWADAPGGHSDNKRWTMTMRNEISAMANKIEPNPNGEWFNTNSDAVRPGDVITSNGILYELGNVRHGFDNDGDYTPDYNAWLQPVGDPNYDPSCFRLIRTHGVLTVSRGAGKPDLIIEFKDWEDPHPVYGGPLYFTNLPEDNNGVKGNVYYTFLALDGPCFTGLSPYQEVASGYDNEKFNGDYGGAMPPNVGSTEPEVTIDKEGNVTVTAGGRVTYTIDIENTSTQYDAGLPLYSMPLVVSDTVPANTTYAGAEGSVGVDYRYVLTDGTYTTTLPSDLSTVAGVQWWLTDTLAAGASGVLTLSVDVDGGASGFIENCAETNYGGGAAFDVDCTTTMIVGDNLVGDYVWQDDDGDGVQDAGEPPIDDVTVSLYRDEDGDGELDDTDGLIMTTTTGLVSSGYYTFTDLPDGNYLVRVDTSDGDLPYGYSLTTAEVYAVDLDSAGTNPSGVSFLDADFGFGPVLSVDKNLASGDPAYEGDTVIYTVDLTNNRPGNGTGEASTCEYTVWASEEDPDHTGDGTSDQWTGRPLGANDYAFGTAELDDQYAYTDYSGGSNRVIAGRGYGIGNQGGGIASVTLRFKVYWENTLSDDTVVATLYYNGGSLGSKTFNSATELQQHDGGIANVGVITWDVTSLRTWDWSDFGGDLDVSLEAQKTSNDDGAILYLDAMGFLITTDETCGGSGSTIATLSFTDTYDPARLTFVSAEPAEDSFSAGVISWDNLGPLYAGQTKRVTVTFTALEPPSNASTVITNSVCSTGATFGNGDPVHTACDVFTNTVDPTGSIGDFVWRDVDGDGNYEPGDGDEGIYGVVLELTSDVTITVGGVEYAPGTVVTTTTDANGAYLFEGLRYTGNYTVAVDTTTLPDGGAGYTNTRDREGAPGDNVTNSFLLDHDSTTGGDSVLNADFGYALPSLIEGTVWHDRDRSGTGSPDAGEEWLTSVTVQLYDYLGVLTDTTTTDANGYFSFTGNYSGTFTVVVITGTGDTSSGTWTPSFDTDDIGTMHQVSVSVVDGGQGRADYSYYQTGSLSIGDKVYMDWDGDGVEDTGEDGISSVTVWLYEDDDGDGVIDSGVDARMMMATTSITGWYSFSGLLADDYIVVVDETDPDLPFGYPQTADPDEAGATCTTCDGQGEVALSTSVVTVDFGYQPRGYGSIGDFVWRDLDRDGVQDGGSETGIGGIQVALYADDGDGVFSTSSDALVAITGTNSSGYYLFDDLPAGTFWVDVDTNDGSLPTDGNGDKYVLSTNNDPHKVVLTAAEDYEDADFGFTPAGRIGDYIWQDNNGDGVQDDGEPGIAGVTVRLYIDTDGDGTGDVLSATTTTDASGIYSFTGIVSDTYVVVVDESGPLSGFTQTGDPDLTTACSGATCDARSALSLRAGQIDMSRDFGYQPPGVIGDYVWFDVNGDGVQDSGEAPIAGVVLTLTPPSGPVVTTTTDADGYYSFGNLSNGTYIVTVDASTLPPSVTQATYDLNGPTDGEATVTISAGGSNFDVDFGYRYSGSATITGHVFFDSGNDGGVYSSTVDTPYDGITVYLVDSSGRQIAQTTTDETGAFTFTNLAGGGITYTVSVNKNSAQLAGTTMTATPSEPGVQCTTCNGYNTVAASATDQDFGFYAALDFGDLPATYNLTKLSDEGPYHSIGTLYLGGGISAEADGRESATAISDTLDNGVTRDPVDLWEEGVGDSGTIVVTVTGGTGYLIGWFDWNQNGDFNDPNEEIRFGSLSAGTHSLGVPLPSAYSTSNTLNVRFRLYDGQPTAISPLGAANNGEVEDYQWTFGPNAVTVLGMDATRSRMMLGASVLLMAVAVLGLGGLLLARQLARQRVRS